MRHTGLSALLALGLAAAAHGQQQGSGPRSFDVKQLRVAGCIDTNFAPVPCQAKSSRPAPPTQVKVGKITYTIEVVPKVPPAGAISGLSGKTCDRSALKHGWCESERRIYLEAGRPLRQEQTTLLHEIQHGILGTDLSERQTTYHRFIYKLSPKLLEVLQENPDLYHYFSASESTE